MNQLDKAQFNQSVAFNAQGVLLIKAYTTLEALPKRGTFLRPQILYEMVEIILVEVPYFLE